MSLGKPRPIWRNPARERLRVALYFAQGKRCGICGNRMKALSTVTLDHVQPQILGGRDEGNLMAAHLHCNQKVKNSRPPTGCELIWLAVANAGLRQQGKVVAVERTVASALAVRHRRTMVSLLQTSKNEVIEMDMREKLARTIDPDVWESFDERAARKQWTPEEREEEFAYSLAKPYSRLAKSLQRADAVLDAMREATPEMIAAFTREAEAQCLDVGLDPEIGWRTMIDAARTPAKES